MTAGEPAGRGLSAAEAAGRLAADGPNLLPGAQSRNTFAIALEVLREPMFLLLVASSGIYLILGDLSSPRALTVDESLQTETARVVKIFATVGLVMCVVLMLLYVMARGGWLSGILAGLTLAMAILPEEFPVVLTVFLALGAWRISQHGVLTRRMPAIETLGSATVLCANSWPTSP